jgi:small-conductance mechanosensitive channel
MPATVSQLGRRARFILIAPLLALMAACQPGDAGGPPQIRHELVVRPLSAWLKQQGFDKAWVPTLVHLVEGVLVVAAFWLVALLASALAGRLASRLIRPTLPEFHERLLELVRGPLRRAVRALGLYLAVLLVPLPSSVADGVAGVIYMLLAYQVVVTAMQGLGLATEEYLHRLDPRQAEQHRNEYVSVVRTLAGFLLVSLAVVNVLNRFGWKLSSVITAFGFIGAAIGLAARDILAQLFSGLTILLDRPFHAGDRLVLQSGEVGDVLRIGARSTEIRLLAGSLVVVPNTELINQRVVNLSVPGTSLQVKIGVALPHGTPLERARALLVEAALAHPLVLSEPAPSAQLVSLSDPTLGLELWCNVRDPLQATEAAHQIRVAIVEKLSAAGLSPTLKAPSPVGPAPAAAPPA